MIVESSFPLTLNFAILGLYVIKIIQLVIYLFLLFAKSINLDFYHNAFEVLKLLLELEVIVKKIHINY
jgi:hypothetical protein